MYISDVDAPISEAETTLLISNIEATFNTDLQDLEFKDDPNFDGKLFIYSLLQ